MSTTELSRMKNFLSGLVSSSAVPELPPAQAAEAAIAAPVGGVTVDAEARAAINSIRAVLTAHGLTE